MKILFVAIDYVSNSVGGDYVTKRNATMLRQLSDSYQELLIPMPGTCTRTRNVIFRENYGNTPGLKRKVRALLQERFDFVIFNSSLFGAYIRMFSRSGIRTCCIYHNVEYNYFHAKYKVSGNPLYRLIIPYIKYQETLSTSYARYLITLNERDSQELKKIYGRSADFLFPTSFAPVEQGLLHPSVQTEPYVLFVGSNFFANVEGLRFLFQEVAPNIKCNILVVGSVCDAFRSQELPGNVKLVGVVDDLLPYYVSATSAVIPIFSGSGLKTKTVEALRYGKYVIGTKESFAGVPIEQYPGIGRLCVSAGEFINAINSCSSRNCFNQESLDVFDSLYSDNLQKERLQVFLAKHINDENRNRF